MKSIAFDDVPRVAGSIRLAGVLLEAHGATVLKIAADWERGISSPTADAGGTRWEECTDPACDECPKPTGTDNERSHYHPKTKDPTGEAAAQSVVDAANPTPRRISDPSGVHRELQQLLSRMFADAIRVNELTAGIVPTDTPIDPVRWCQNHAEVGLCEPRHRGDECRFCYDFRLLWGRRPPPTILGTRHRGGRVTEKQIKEALDGETRHTEAFTRIDTAIRNARHTPPTSTPSTSSSSAGTPAAGDLDVDDLDVDDPALRVADALSKFLAAQEKGASAKRVDRAWKRYAAAHHALVESRTNPTTKETTPMATEWMHP